LRADLFDLEKDPGQRNDVASDPAYSAVVSQLDEQLVTFYRDHSDPRYDLWRGGRAKGSVLRPDLYRGLYGPQWAPTWSTEPTFAE
jgi:hypothetical protein